MPYTVEVWNYRSSYYLRDTVALDPPHQPPNPELLAVL
jgi:hypothetical protein